MASVTSSPLDIRARVPAAKVISASSANCSILCMSVSAMPARKAQNATARYIAPGININESQLRRDRAGNGALPCSGGTIDGDHDSLMRHVETSMVTFRPQLSARLFIRIQSLVSEIPGTLSSNPNFVANV